MAPSIRHGSTAPQTSARQGSTAPGTPIRQDSEVLETPRRPDARFRAIQEALSELESSSQTFPGPTSARNTPTNSIHSRLRSIEDSLHGYEERNGLLSPSSPATPTFENSSIEARLSAVEAAVNDILTREAQCRSLQSGIRGIWQRSPNHSVSNVQVLDGRDSPSADGRDPYFILDGHDRVPTASRHSSTPVAGSSTGPGTLAGAAGHANSSTGSRSPLTTAVDLEDLHYQFDPFSPEEDAQLEELLNALHENFLVNKKN